MGCTISKEDIAGQQHLILLTKKSIKLCCNSKVELYVLTGSYMYYALAKFQNYSTYKTFNVHVLEKNHWADILIIVSVVSLFHARFDSMRYCLICETCVLTFKEFDEVCLF